MIGKNWIHERKNKIKKIGSKPAMHCSHYQYLWTFQLVDQNTKLAIISSQYAAVNWNMLQPSRLQPKAFYLCKDRWQSFKNPAHWVPTKQIHVIQTGRYRKAEEQNLGSTLQMTQHYTERKSLNSTNCLQRKFQGSSVKQPKVDVQSVQGNIY